MCHRSLPAAVGHGIPSGAAVSNYRVRLLAAGSAFRVYQVYQVGPRGGIKILRTYDNESSAQAVADVLNHEWLHQTGR